MTTCVIAVYGTFSSSAAICAKAVLAEPWPISTLPVRIRIVLSAWISIHESRQASGRAYVQRLAGLRGLRADAGADEAEPDDQRAGALDERRAA